MSKNRRKINRMFPRLYVHSFAVYIICTIGYSKKTLDFQYRKISERIHIYKYVQKCCVNKLFCRISHFYSSPVAIYMNASIHMRVIISIGQRGAVKIFSKKKKRRVRRVIARELWNDTISIRKRL